MQGDEHVDRPVPVDLDELVSAAAHEAGGEFVGCYLNQETGDAVPTVSTDEGMVGEDAIDVEGAEWLYLELEGTIWSDLEEFKRTVTDESTRNQLAQAIDGKGAFSRFRRVTDERGLRQEWLTFRTDREWGRARATLAEPGARSIP